MAKERELMTRIAYLEAALVAVHGEDADSVSALSKYTMQVEAERSQLKLALAAANEQLRAANQKLGGELSALACCGVSW